MLRLARRAPVATGWPARLRPLGPGVHRAPWTDAWIVADPERLASRPELLPDGPPTWEGQPLRPALYGVEPLAARTGKRHRDTRGFWLQFLDEAPVSGRSAVDALDEASAIWTRRGEVELLVAVADAVAATTWGTLLGVPGPAGRALLLWGRRRLGRGAPDDADALALALLRDATVAAPGLARWAALAERWRLDDDVATLLAVSLAERVALPRVRTAAGLWATLALSPRLGRQLADAPELRAGAVAEAARLFGGPRATRGRLVDDLPGSPSLPAGSPVILAPHLARTHPAVTPDPERMDPRRLERQPELRPLLPDGPGGADDPVLAALLDAVLARPWSSATLPRLDLDGALPFSPADLRVTGLDAA